MSDSKEKGVQDGRIMQRVKKTKNPERGSGGPE